MLLLTGDEIKRLNFRTVSRHGGHYVPPDNLLHPDALAYLVDTVDAELFGEPMYPTVADRASLYLFNIISNHVFHDGNKRTGLAASLAFLIRNGFQLKADLRAFSDDEFYTSETTEDHDTVLYRFVLAVAAGQVSLDACRAWFAANVVLVEA